MPIKEKGGVPDEGALRSRLTFSGMVQPKYAVVIPLVYRPEGVELLVEIRAAGISQSGEPCFPGGHIEAGERSKEAALREMKEELGIAAPESALLGIIPTVHTPFGLVSDIYVCRLTGEMADAMQPNPDEVERVLRVKLDWLLKRPDESSYSVDGAVIWGMTAGAIHNLIQVWNEAMKITEKGEAI